MKSSCSGGAPAPRRLFFCFLVLAVLSGRIGATGDNDLHEHAHTLTAVDHAWLAAAHFAKGDPNAVLADLELPPAPDGVTDLTFSEFFKMPVGPRGLEPTAKLRSLDGQNVRLAGFMVRQELRSAGAFLLAPTPVQTHESEYGLADEVPVTTVRVCLDDAPHTEPALLPGAIVLIGRLDLGSRPEPDGRNSYVRLHLTSADLPAAP